MGEALIALSFVSITARTNFITVCSDGQVTGPNGEILQNDFQKFIAIDNRAFIAFAGTKDLCEMIIRDTNIDLAKPFRFLEWAKYFEYIFNKLDLKSAYLNGIKMLAAFGGKNSEGHLEFYTIHSKDSLYHQYRPEQQNDIEFAFLHSGQSTLNPRDVFVESLRISGINTPEQMIAGQKMLNYRISQTDSDVNNTTFTLTIR